MGKGTQMKPIEQLLATWYVARCAVSTWLLYIVVDPLSLSLVCVTDGRFGCLACFVGSWHLFALADLLVARDITLLALRLLVTSVSQSQTRSMMYIADEVGTY